MQTKKEKQAKALELRKRQLAEWKNGTSADFKENNVINFSDKIKKCEFEISRLEEKLDKGY